MRVTKKFSGTSCIGKSVFCPAEPTPQNLELVKVRARLRAHVLSCFRAVARGSRPFDGWMDAFGLAALSVCITNDLPSHHPE